MKIIWLGNVVLPKIAEMENIPKVFLGGWMVSLSERLGTMDNIELCYIFDSKHSVSGSTKYYKYYGIECGSSSSKRLGKDYIQYAIEILNKEKPDVVHIWGTENAHSLGMVEACEQVGILNRVIISIQGLVSVYAKHYHAFLSEKVTHGKTIKDILKGNLQKQQKKFVQMGLLEEKALRKVRHVIGRTDWDKACVWNINPNIIYHFNNETLRSEFYDGCWSYNTCEKFSIFCSQAHYPIKGIHLMLESLKIIKRQFPEVHLYVGGKNYMDIPVFQHSRYEKYISILIKRYNLIENVTFTGFLDANQMKDRYLRSNVFVSPSSIENSPNSVGEAMLLGVPVVSSIVGGVHNLLEHAREGFLYPADEPYMMAYYVCRIFDNKALACKLSRNARKQALQTHDEDENLKELLNIYRCISN
ncbi:glycosyltransferase family 4 protein [Clostridium kluyveri]|uniref:glycosyltransferase family 4 protein n=1 Tax=Clostridium kluyveri TaxID=1534 RepID=UPI0022463EF9|nr:glycosyltransferase family 4 protein [Clostridium kluyveri]UZQ50359.1 glycosyltransferase family 4 protein [Clostridium kluyveri]